VALVVECSGANEAGHVFPTRSYAGLKSTDGGTTWGLWGNAGGTLSSTLTAKGEKWKARGRAWDGTAFGAWLESSPGEIGNKAPNGTYEIVDILPAGLAYVTRPYTRNEKPNQELVYPSEVNGQQLTFSVWKGNGKLVYYARVLTPGEYESGAPYLGNTKSNKIFITGSKDKVVIKGGKS